MDLKRSARESFVLTAVAVCFALIYNYFSATGIPLLYYPVTIPDQDNISAAAAYHLFQNGRAVFIDARPPEEIDGLVIPGSYNVPISWSMDRIAEYMNRFKPDQTLVIYCSEPECHFSVRLAGMLKYFKFSNVLVFRGGIKEWSENGFPLRAENE